MKQGLEKQRRMELGIAISGALLQPGEHRTLKEIAAFAGCSKQAIHALQNRALAKLFKALDPHLTPSQRNHISQLIKL